MYTCCKSTADSQTDIKMKRARQHCWLVKRTRCHTHHRGLGSDQGQVIHPSHLDTLGCLAGQTVYLASSQGASLVKTGNVHIGCHLELSRVQQINAMPPQPLQSDHGAEDDDCWATNRYRHNNGVQESKEGGSPEIVDLGLGRDGGNVDEEVDDKGEDVHAQNILQGSDRTR